ncbi:hypothetical protein Dimus_036705, partial [Dionaea muscipula]
MIPPRCHRHFFTLRQQPSAARSPCPVAFSVQGHVASTVTGGPSSRFGWLRLEEKKLTTLDFDDVGCETLDLMRRSE